MKFIHLSDLHLGKRVNGFSLMEDQEYILKQILQICDEEKPDAAVIAGDVYDKSVPSAEAVTLLDGFLCRLAERKLQILLIAGNHDSAERLAFGGRLLEQAGVHISPVYDGSAEHVVLNDGYGSVSFWLLPFLKPAHVRAFMEEGAEEVATYTDAVREALRRMGADFRARNVLVCHQFVTGAVRSESEDVAVGGLDNVDASVFQGFDYVALGHIHGPQNVDGNTVRYCGTPLKYSFSEKDHVKSVTVVEMREKGDLDIRTVPLIPLRDMREVRGTYDEVTLKANYEGTNTEDYLRVVLTDEQDVPDAVAKLRIIYPNLMRLDYDNLRTRTQWNAEAIPEEDRRSALELVDLFYEKQNGTPLDEAQKGYAASLLERIKEELQ